MNKNYDRDFYGTEKEYSRNSADILIPYILERLQCKTVVDFGCGVGECLNAVKNVEGGAERVMGLDGEWVREHLEIEEREFYSCDLTKEIDLKEKYDLAISLEVAEHLPEKSARTYIANLVRHADIILFSAAIPHQGGTYHVNEQYPSYWKNIFEEFGFSICDCIRNYFWNDERISGYYRQNMFLYCKSNLYDEISKKFECGKQLVDVIHPCYWETRNKYDYIFPFEKVHPNAKIILYGAGKVGKIFADQLLATKYAKTVLWCDRAFEDYGIHISDPQKIKEVSFEYIIIATEKERTALSVIDDLVKMGVPNEKIVWRAPMFQKQY